MTPFTKLMESALALEGALSATIPEDWMQGRSAYGGLQGALLLRTMRSLVPSRPIRSLQINCVAPLSGDVRAEAAVLREGKNATQVEAKLYGQNGAAAHAIGVFGAARTSVIEETLTPAPIEGDQCITFPYIPGLTPAFTQHFAVRLRKGHLPFSNTKTRSSVYELDLKDQGTATDEAVVALADFVPPLGMSELSAPTFGSTLSWFLEFLLEVPSDMPLEKWRLDSELTAAKDGYSHQSSTLWGPNGSAVALSRQTMLVFG